jgi:hypothetical protein
VSAYLPQRFQVVLAEREDHGRRGRHRDRFEAPVCHISTLTSAPTHYITDP